MTVILLTVVTVSSIVAGFLERRSVYRAADAERAASRAERDSFLDRMRDERHDWANERSALLDRIKPETAQPPPHLPGVETFQPPTTDEDYWDRSEVVTEG